MDQAAPRERRLVVLISGSGTNLQALLDACGTSALPRARVAFVLSNRKAAYGLVRAAEAHVPTKVFALQPYLKANPGKTRQDYDEEVARIVLEAQPDAVVLAGWMHVLSEAFLSLLAGTRSLPGLHTSAHPIPVINLHPALPGAFDGVDAIARAHTAFEEGKVDRTGVMVHRVVAAVDAGAPVLVREVPIVKGEPLGALEKRVHEAEWAVIVEATGIVLDEAEQVEKTT